jgi:SpoVK/Ycf46/Vps4 family AAA+-type ATPase
MSCTISKDSFDTDDNRIKGQQMKLAPGVTIFWYKSYLLWAVTDVTSNLRAGEVTNVVINSFRWNSSILEEFIINVYSEKSEPVLYTYKRYWALRNRIIETTKETYISNNGTLETVESYVKYFINAKQNYTNQQRPYKTGILLEGPPGVGKSTLIMYLAHRFNRPVYLLFASDLSNNDDISEIINSIPSNAFLLFEDFDGIDSLTSERNDEEDEEESPRNKRNKLSAEGLLKKLQSTFDGFLSPNNGLIYFINTNHIEKIDPTLIRDGRIDLRVTFTYATDDWICSRFKREFPKTTQKQFEQITTALKDIDVVQSKFSRVVSSIKPFVKEEMEKSSFKDDEDTIICDIAVRLVIDNILDKTKTD